MSLSSVLQLLADGEVHSGEELGEVLGVSRTAVWKQLQKLDDLGLCLVTVKGRGYQLPGGVELLDQQRILDQLKPQTRDLLKHLDVVGSIDSTNIRAMAEARAGNGGGYVCIAEHQTAGRGRHGRNWVSPFGRNIYLSAVWEFTQGAAVLEGMSLAVGVAIARVINSHQQQRDNANPNNTTSNNTTSNNATSNSNSEKVQLKWPNDVYWQGKKLAGVLLEMSGDASGCCQVVVGVGLNLSMMAEEASAIDQRWVSLDSIAAGISRNALAAGLLDEILLLLSRFDQSGFSAYQQEWQSLDFLRNKDVDIRVGEHLLQGRVVGVSDSGALRIVNGEGEQLIYGGEASVRSRS